MKPCLYMFIGLPGSGKSTFRGDILLKHTHDPREMTFLSTDDFIEGLAREKNSTYQQEFKEGSKQAQVYMNINLRLAVERNDNIVWDQTNLNVKARKKKLSQIPNSYNKVAVYFKTSLDTIKKVNDDRQQFGRSIPDSVIRSMLDTVEEPSLNEGFDQIITIERE